MASAPARDGALAQPGISVVAAQPAMPLSYTETGPLGWRAKLWRHPAQPRRQRRGEVVGRDRDRRRACESAGVAAVGLTRRAEAAGAEVELLPEADAVCRRRTPSPPRGCRRRRRATSRRGSVRPRAGRRGRAPPCTRGPAAARHSRLRPRAARACRAARPPSRRRRERARRRAARAMRNEDACLSGCHGTRATASPVRTGSFSARAGKRALVELERHARRALPRQLRPRPRHAGRPAPARPDP